MIQLDSMEVGFPFQLDPRGRVESPSLAVHLEQLIEQLLLTGPGERVNRPTLGTPLEQAVFATISREQMHALEALVQSAIQKWLWDRVRVEKVTLTYEGNDLLTVQVSYRAPDHPELMITTIHLRRAL